MRCFVVFIVGLSIRLVAFAQPAPGIKFIENKNQWPSSVQYSGRIPGGHMLLQRGKLVYCFLDEKKIERLHERTHEPTTEYNRQAMGHEVIDGYSLEVDIIGAKTATPRAFGKSHEYYNYFIGDSSTWASHAFAYEGVYYSSVYDGIDLKIYSQGENGKYDFLVAPGANPNQIKLQYDGAQKILFDGADIEITMPLGSIIEKKPIAYQFINGKKVLVSCSYHVNDSQISFLFPHGYDTCYPLTIDPLLIFSTYSGSTADNWGSTATPGEHGTLYSSGITNLNHGGVFPAKPGAFQTTYGGLYDVGLLKYDSAGKQLLYASYLGGSLSESPHSLVMNPQQELLVLGTTSSHNFPTTPTAYDRTFNGGFATSNVISYEDGSDIFIARISRDGTQLLAATYLGGADNDGMNPGYQILTRNYGDELRGDIIADQMGNVYVSSVTPSDDFPVANGIHTTYLGGLTDAVVLKMNKDLSVLIWSTFMGGSDVDASHTIKFDSKGDLYVAGGTSSSDFPATANAYQKNLKGDADGWIAKIKNDGSAVDFATLTGTTSFDQVYFLDLGSDDRVYVYGQTDGDFPVTPGVYNNPHSGQFIQKFDSTLTTLVFSTVFGSGIGQPNISPTAFMVNDCNNIYASGWGGMINQGSGYWNTNTVGMATTPDAIQRTTSGSDFYFMVLTNDGKEFLYGTYLGGTESRTHVDGGTSRFDKSGVVYHAVCSGCRALNATGQSSSDFPTTPGAWSHTNNSYNCNNAAFKFDLSILKARLQTNSVTLDMPGLNKICIPDKIVFQNKSYGGEFFEWDLGDGTAYAVTDTAMLPPHQYQHPGDYVVRLKAIDHGTCIGEDATATVVHVFDAQATLPPDDTICYGQPYMLIASGGATYHWESSDGSFTGDGASVTVQPSENTSYYLTVTENSGCVRRDTVVVEVRESLSPNFDVARQSNCISQPKIFLSNTTMDVGPKDLMFFDFGDGTTSDLENVEHRYEKDGVYVVKLVGVRGECVSEKIALVPAFKLLFPNILTPGIKDGKNDTFIVGFGSTGEITPDEYGFPVSLVIYDRWGKKVFESADYKHDWSPDNLTSGVYYYDVTVKDHATCRSWLQIITDK